MNRVDERPRKEPPHLDVIALRLTQNARIRRRQENFDKILLNCHRLIRKMSLAGVEHCLFHIPPFMLGHPPYKLDECVTYIMSRLRADKLLVNVVQMNGDGAQILVQWPQDPMSIAPTPDVAADVDLSIPQDSQPVVKGKRKKGEVQSTVAMMKFTAASGVEDCIPINHDHLND